MTVKEFLEVFDVCEMIIKRWWCYVGGGYKEIVYAKIDDLEDEEKLENFYHDVEKVKNEEIRDVYKHRDTGTIIITLMNN